MLFRPNSWGFFAPVAVLCGLGIALLPSSEAEAGSCTPTSGAVLTGGTVTCTGTVVNQDAPNGYGTGAQTGITVNLNANTSVSGDSSGIFINSGTVNIPTTGTVSSANGNGILAPPGTLTVNNAGVVSAPNATFVIFSNNTIVNNSGTITGGAPGSGVLTIVGTSVAVTNTATGSITGDIVIFDGGGATAVGNAGSIVGGTYAIEAHTTITGGNSSTGTITGGIDAIRTDLPGATINFTNSGAIAGGTNGGGSGSGINTNGGGAINLMNTATGVVSGPTAGVSGGDVTLDNAGTIAGTGGVGSGSIGVSGNVLNITNTATGVISGDFAIEGGNNSTIVNNGTVSATTFGISLGSNNTVSNGGMLTVNNGLFAIVLNDMNAVTNTGTITLIGFGGTGIFAGNNNMITNSGTIAVGIGGAGIETSGTGNTITNASTGKIIGGDGAFGIEVFDNSTVVNDGAIVTGAAGTGIAALGSNIAVTNNGTVTVGDESGSPSIGILIGIGGTATNNGKVVAGVGSTGMQGSLNSTLINNGTIVAGNGGSDFSAGIDAQGFGPGADNIVINNGKIIVGDAIVGVNNTAGINLGDGGTVTNNGTIIAGANGISIGTCGCVAATNNTVTNNGLLDGRLNLDAFGGPGNFFANNGVITITDAATPVGAAHLVNGTFTQSAMGTLALRVNNAGASDTLATDTANLGGKIGAVVQTGLYANSTTYLGVLAATNPITTMFGSAQAFAMGTTTPLVFFSVTPTYNPNTVDLTLNRIGFGAVPGETPTEQGVGNALNMLYSTGLTGAEAAGFANLLQATSTSVLDQFAAEGYADLNSILLEDGVRFSNAIFGALNNLQPGAGPVAQGRRIQLASSEPWHVGGGPAEGPWGAWVGGAGMIGAMAGNGGAHGLSYNAGGGAAGLDYRFTPNFTAGVAAGAVDTNFNLSGVAQNGQATSYQFAAYGGWHEGRLYADGMIGYAYDTETMQRGVTFPVPGQEIGNTTGNQFIAAAEFGYAYPVAPRYFLTPFFDLEAGVAGQNGFTESGPKLTALSVAGQTDTSFRTVLGGQFSGTYDAGLGGPVSLMVRAGLAHEFAGVQRLATENFAAVPGISFPVAGLSPSRDSGEIGAGIELPIAPRVVAYARYDGAFSGADRANAVTGGLRVSW